MNGYQVKVLRPGSVVWLEPTQLRADGTITLVTGPKTILVDTGGPWDQQILLALLSKEGVRPEQVDYVVGTHGHSDHIGNLNLFPETTLIVSHDISKGDLYTLHD